MAYQETPCDKVAYPSKKEAQSKMNYLRNGRVIWEGGKKIRHKIKRRVARIYPCPICKYWHITHEAR